MGKSELLSKLEEHKVVSTCIILVLVVFFMICWGFLYVNNEEKWLYVCILFAIPIGFQIIVLLMAKAGPFRVFCEVLPWVSSFVVLVAWFCYAIDVFSDYLAWFWIIWAFLLVAGAFWVTCFLIRSRQDPSNNPADKLWYFNLATDMRKYPFLTLCSFISVFLCVTYLLSFAFAFHDKSIRNKTNSAKVALYLTNLAAYNDEEEKPTSSSSKKSEIQGHNGTEDQDSLQNVSSSDKIQIQFFQCSADVVWCKKWFCTKDSDERINHIKGAFNKEKTRNLAIKNDKAIHQFVDDIHKIDPYKHIIVKLIGHCSKEHPQPNEVEEEKQQYLSNYELAQARASYVQLVLSEALLLHVDCKNESNSNKDKETKNKGNVKIPWYNIEWYLSSLSGEKHSQNGNKFDEWRKVDISIESVPERMDALGLKLLEKIPCQPQQRNLTLLDYVYFTIYTITTTGYGDILPVTQMAKFIASIANLFELFFILDFGHF